MLHAFSTGCNLSGGIQAAPRPTQGSDPKWCVINLKKPEFCCVYVQRWRKVPEMVQVKMICSKEESIRVGEFILDQLLRRPWWGPCCIPGSDPGPHEEEEINCTAGHTREVRQTTRVSHPPFPVNYLPFDWLPEAINQFNHSY